MTLNSNANMKNKIGIVLTPIFTGNVLLYRKLILLQFENARIGLSLANLVMRYLLLLWFMILKYRVSNSKKNEPY
jgi:hypothetical protein